MKCDYTTKESDYILEQFDKLNERLDDLQEKIEALYIDKISNKIPLKTEVPESVNPIELELFKNLINF